MDHFLSGPRRDTFNKSNLTINGSAVIVGASLAGLMTGIGLARAGLSVTILERASAQPRSGAVLQVDSGDVDRTESAKYLRKLASGGSQSVEAWSSVQSRLRAHAEACSRIDIRYDTRVQSVGQDTETAWVVTSTGETVCGDMLIGADGHRSLVRGQVAPQKPHATFVGYLIWIGLLDETDIRPAHRPARNAPATTMLNGQDDFILGSIVAGIDGSRSLGNRRIGWAWYDNTRNDLLRRLGCVAGNLVCHPLNGADIPQQTLVELAKQARIRWPQPWLAATLHSIQTRNLTAMPIAEYVPDRLVQGRIVLVGDAAHVLTPITASGFNASLQDAAILADCVAREIQGSRAIEALLMYESLRLANVRQLVQSGQSFSRSFSKYCPLDGLFQTITCPVYRQRNPTRLNWERLVRLYSQQLNPLSIRCLCTCSLLILPEPPRSR